MPTIETLRPQDKVYEPRGAQKIVWRSGKRMVVYSGRTRVGKTTLCCHLAQSLCIEYPGCRVLFLRQTRHSMTESVLVTFENEVLRKHLINNPVASRRVRQSYDYANGSTIVIGGMDDPDKFLSGEYDLIIIFQAEQCGKDATMKVQGRLVHFLTPTPRLILDVNPREQNHWIKKMCEEGKAMMVKGSLQDNPKFYNWEKQEWTRAGLAIFEGDKNYSASDYQRLALGKWCSPEGARFPKASRQVQGFDTYTLFPLGFPSHWKRWICVDYGKADPYAAYWITRNEERRYFIYREDYTPGYEADEQILRIVAASPQNEKYEGLWMDGSMWQKGEYARGFGAQGEKGSAAKQYWSEMVKEEHAGRFGTLHKGQPNKDERNYIELSALLNSGDLLIERSCTHLWDEIEGAVHWKDQRTGISSELVNPGGRKFCPDHALEAIGYGLVNRSPVTLMPEDTSLPADYDDARGKQVQAMRETLDKSRVAAIKAERPPNWLRRF